jgi:hypothetical protein
MGKPIVPRPIKPLRFGDAAVITNSVSSGFPADLASALVSGLSRLVGWIAPFGVG